MGQEIFVTSNNYSYLGIKWPSGQIPSGQPGWNLDASLASLRAKFGFNSEPHQFDLTFIPVGSGYGHGASGNLAPINTDIEMQISGFYLRGLISHIDWSSNDGGTIISVMLRDRRKTLDFYKITTEDIDDNLPSGFISVAKYFREVVGVTTSTYREWPVTGTSGNYTEAEDSTFREYIRIIENGATYSQILSAIDWAFGSGVSSKLPTVSEIVANIGTDINALRWKLDITPISELISAITLDTAYDWYWNMSLDKVALINKKTPFSVPESNILRLINSFGGTSGTDIVKSIAYGKDVVEEPQRVHLMGAYQEGIMNSPLLSPIDGLDTIYDGLTTSGTLVFEAAWPLLTIGFYDHDGFYRTYIPSEKELQMAIAGIEQWTYFKKYQSAASPSGWDISPDDGSIAAQHPDFQSRLDPRQPIAEILTNPDNNIRVISNRRDLENNWVIDFFNRVNQHAQRHYGKTYVTTHGLTYNDRMFIAINEAWCGVENQKQDPSGLFTDDYEIDRRYGPISPFITEDGKIRPFVKLPSGTVYGPLGEDTPTSFASWTEDAPPFNPSGDGSHYIPCDIGVVGQRVQDPRHDGNYSFEPFPENTLMCQLPEIAASGTVQDSVLASLATLTEYALQLENSGIIDLIDPRRVVIPYNALSGVAVPVRSTERYGQNYPSVWASGIVHPIYGTKITINDDLNPWVTYPEGVETSIEKLERYAFEKLNAEIANQQDSQYLEVNQVGLPMISFDSFANQNPNASGLIGERDHGVSDVSIDYGPNGLTTLYKIQSYYAPYNRAHPLTNRTRFRINGIVNPIDYIDLGNFLASFGPTVPTDTSLAPNKFNGLINFDFERQEACEVIAVHNIFDANAAQRVLNGNDVPVEERYYAVVKRKRTFVYGETNYVLEPGLNTVAHNLNSMDVTVTFIEEGIGVGGIKHLQNIELDPFSVLVNNTYAAAMTGTIIIENGEGIVRPTNETIRRADDVDDYGAPCNDGYLNLEDPCVYIHKRVADEEMAYFTGGRQLNPGLIVQVESSDGDGKYRVSMLGDRHGRYLWNLSVLNSQSVSIGQQMPIAPTAAGAAKIKPGPESTGFILVPAASGGTGGGEAAQITVINNLGSSGATATVKQLTANSILGSTSYSGVYLLPYPQLAESGDRGVLVTYTPTSGSELRYLHINKSIFIGFTP